MKTNAAFVILFVLTVNVNAQINTHANGGRLAAMGNAGVAVADVWSAVNNQAALTGLDNAEIAVFYKNNFGLSELSLSALSVVLPTKIGVFGGNVAHFGFSEYNESKVSVAFAKQLWKKFSLSAQINYHNVNFTSGYRDANAVSGEIGLLACLYDNLSVGAHVFNPTQSALSLENNEKLPVLYKAGVAYKPISTLLFCSDFIFGSDNEISFCGGVEYYLIPQLCLRAGVSTNPDMFTLGAGYRYKKMNFDVAYSYHNVLGNISCVSVSYTFGKK